MGYNRPITYTLSIGFSSSSPNDSTTYYFGGTHATAITTTATLYYVLIPRSGFIRQAVLHTDSTTAAGTGEDIVIAIRKNNTTDYAFCTTGAAAIGRDFTNYNLNIPVNAGDYIVMKMSTPAWVTNPDGMRGNGSIIVETF